MEDVEMTEDRLDELREGRGRHWYGDNSLGCRVDVQSLVDHVRALNLKIAGLARELARRDVGLAEIDGTVIALRELARERGEMSATEELWYTRAADLLARLGQKSIG